GARTSALSWSWIFFINVPVGVLVIGLTPWLLRESRAELGHRHFDFAGAASITGGLMLLVYAMTRATQHGWTTAETIGLLAALVALIAAFFVIELRSKAPLLPLRIFRLRTLSASNLSGLLMGGAIFAQFFLLTLYMQQVLHYSALKTGVAYIGLTLTIIAFSAVAQALVTRIGVRRVLPAGLALSTVALVLFARLPVNGHYFSDLFPAFMISGLGLALAFVPMSIGALTGVTQADAGIASGLINTTQQIGGAIGVAVATTIATTFTAHYVSAHAGSNALSGPALTHGFAIAFYVLAALSAVGALVAALLLESTPAQPEAELAPVSFGLFMIMLDNTVVNVALPSIRKDLGISISELEWVVNAYALTFGVLLLSGGKLADLLGRRAIFIAGLVIFTAASLWCGLAAGATSLIAARTVQGIGARADAVRDRRRLPRVVRAARAASAPPDARSVALQEPDVQRREHGHVLRRARDVRDLLLQLAVPPEHPALRRDQDGCDIPA